MATTTPTFNPASILQTLGAVTSKPQSNGRKSVFSSSMELAGAGAQLGSIAGPWGMGIGAGVGTIAGVVKGLADKKRDERMQVTEANNLLASRKLAGNVYTGGNPEEIFGNKSSGYFKKGGKLKTYKNGGKLSGYSIDSAIEAQSKMSKHTAQLSGPSHAEGGVPVLNGEAEGNETMSRQPEGTYILSNLNGFSRMHRGIARQLNKIERKPITPERAASLKRLHTQERNLITLQQMLNGNA